MAISILMVPIITRTSEEVLRTVPGSLRDRRSPSEGPSGARSCVSSCRRPGRPDHGRHPRRRPCVGETAAVLFTVRGSRTINYNPFHTPQADLPLTVLQNVQSPSQNFLDEAHGGALVLVALVLTLFTLARVIGRQRTSARPSLWRRIGPGGRRSPPGRLAAAASDIRLSTVHLIFPLQMDISKYWSSQ